MRVAIVGAGRMGRLVAGEVLSAGDLELVGIHGRVHSDAIGIDVGVLAGLPPCGISVSALPARLDADVVVDVSAPEGLRATLRSLDGAALVTGTTGIPDALQRDLESYASRAPVVQAANFSTGVNLLLDLVARAARALPDYDIEIVEAHHRHKRDAPSGTALALGRAAAAGRGALLADLAVHGRVGDTGERPVGPIGFHALRLGDVVGDHAVWLGGPGERLCLGHVATSRRTFAQGAVRATRWIVGRPPGVHGMADVLGL